MFVYSHEPEGGGGRCEGPLARAMHAAPPGGSPKRHPPAPAQGKKQNIHVSNSDYSIQIGAIASEL